MPSLDVEEAFERQWRLGEVFWHLLVSVIVLSSEGISTPTTPNYPRLGWRHDKDRSGAAESQDGHCHFGSRQQP